MVDMNSVILQYVLSRFKECIGMAKKHQCVGGKKVYTKKEVIEELGICISTLNRRLIDGTIKYIKLGEGKKSRVLIPKEEIEKLFKL